MIPAHDAINAINVHREEAVVVSTTAALRIWSSASRRRDLDVDLSDCMDKASSVGLGVALALPSRKVLVLDCDSVLRTGLSSLTTIGNASPRNLVHFLFEDGDYMATDGQPISGMERIDYPAHAKAGGYARTCQFGDLEDLVISLQDLLEDAGPTFVSLKVVYQQDMPSFPQRTMAESVAIVRAALDQKSSGISPLSTEPCG